MTELERMGFIVQPISKTCTPFSKWAGSQLKDFNVTIKLLTTGEQMEVARRLSNDSPTTLVFSSKLHLLSRAIISINGKPIISDDELKQYRTDNKIDDQVEFTSLDYAILFLKKLPTQAIDALTYEYDVLQNEFVAKLLGVALPDLAGELKINTAEVGPENESVDKKGN